MALKPLIRALFRAAPRGTDLSIHHVPIADLGLEFHGYTIAVLSDFHHAPTRDLALVRRAVDATNAMSPDLVTLLGDYGSSFKRAPARSLRWYRKALPALAPELRRLRSRDGIVAVLGNHDYYAGASYVHDWLRSNGAEVLVNRVHRIVRSGSVLRIAGADDLVEGDLDPRVGCEPSEWVPTVVLSHNPDAVMQLAHDVRVDLMVAGHTHGGQIVVPGYGAPITMSRVCGRRSASGWIATSRTRLYVTRGLGVQLPLPLRINCPPEIVILRLWSGVQQPA